MSETTSESILGIPKPPDHQCPDIDGYVNNANIIESAISDALKCDELEDMKSNVEDADWHASDIKGYFEDLRENMDLLRQWGQEWKDLAKRLIEDHEPELLEVEK